MNKILKLKKRHPNNRMQLGRHIIINAPSEFDLNETEVKELETIGCKTWIEEVKKEMKPKKETKVKPKK